MSETTHNSLPIPIRIRRDKYGRDLGDWECICKGCQKDSHIWNMCLLCNQRVWFSRHKCSLYAYRSPYLVCFNCRMPFYDKGMTNGEIYRMAKLNREMN